VAWRLTHPKADMLAGLVGVLAVAHLEHRDKSAALNMALRGDVWHILNDQVSAADGNIVALVPQTLQVRIKTD
jgi:hypothetical protein